MKGVEAAQPDSVPSASGGSQVFELTERPFDHARSSLAVQSKVPWRGFGDESFVQLGSEAPAKDGPESDEGIFDANLLAGLVIAAVVRLSLIHI